MLNLLLAGISSAPFSHSPSISSLGCSAFGRSWRKLSQGWKAGTSPRSRGAAGSHGGTSQSSVLVGARQAGVGRLPCGRRETTAGFPCCRLRGSHHFKPIARAPAPAQLCGGAKIRLPGNDPAPASIMLVLLPSSCQEPQSLGCKQTTLPSLQGQGWLVQ